MCLSWFQVKRTCLDWIIAIAHAIIKQEEYRFPIYLFYINFGKTFDKVWTGWAIMAKEEQRLIGTIQSLYVKNKILIETIRPNTTPSVVFKSATMVPIIIFSFYFIYRRCHSQ